MDCHFKFSGRVAPGSLLHSTKQDAPDGALVPPSYEHRSNWGDIPVYGPTVVDNSTGYNPAGNCNGNFMSSKFQPNNNCYAYGCNITPNSFPQPGRYSDAKHIFAGHSIAPVEVVVAGAIADGLLNVGTTLDDCRAFAQTNPPSVGHFVALMYSPSESAIGGDPEANWPGDYHWARCDDLENNAWSQKDGSDQVTNFDFAGNPITDPATANWRVNQGPIGGGDANEYRASYYFHTYMFVPYGKVNIL